MRVRKNRKKKVVVATIALALVGSAAFAYWTMRGAGEGSVATQADGQALVVEQNPTTPIAPGGTIALSGKITNPNSTSVKLGTLTAALGNTGGVDPAEFLLGGVSNSDSVIIKGGSTLDWTGLTLTYLDSATVNQDAGRGVTVGLTYTLTPNAQLAQVNVNSWDRSIAIDATSIANGNITLLAGTTIVPSTLGTKVATLTTTVTTDAATSHDFDLFASGFISRAAGETIARSTLFATSHDGDPLLYAQDNTSGTNFCWDNKFYVNGAFVFTQSQVPQLCGPQHATPGGSYTYVTKVHGNNTWTTEVSNNGVSLGILHGVLPKDPATEYQPILRTFVTAPPQGETGALVISNSTLTVQ